MFKVLIILLYQYLFLICWKGEAYLIPGGTRYAPGSSTWYLAHPAFSLFVASWFSFFLPWTSYWLFVLFSIAIMGYCGYLISKLTDSVYKKYISYLLLVCALPTYWMLFVGNMHAPLVLALTLILISIYELAYSENEKDIKTANKKLLLGLLISFFSKPILITRPSPKLPL